jgi:hypothetical protein
LPRKKTDRRTILRGIIFRSTIFRWIAVIVLLSCVTAPVHAQAAKHPDPVTPVYPLDSFQNFSAVMVGSRAEPGEGTSQGHIYRSGKLMRMEEPEGRAYFITDLSVGETYGIMEGSCIRDEHPYIRAIPFYLAGMADATATRTPAGKEVLDGHTCQVEDVSVSSPMLPNPQKMRFWEADDLEEFPIKIEFLLPGGRGPIIRYKNVVLGAQDPTLFIHPKSCQPLPQEPTASAGPKPPSAQ